MCHASNPFIVSTMRRFHHDSSPRGNQPNASANNKDVLCGGGSVDKPPGERRLHSLGQDVLQSAVGGQFDDDAEEGSGLATAGPETATTTAEHTDAGGPSVASSLLGSSGADYSPLSSSSAGKKSRGINDDASVFSHSTISTARSSVASESQGSGLGHSTSSTTSRSSLYSGSQGSAHPPIKEFSKTTTKPFTTTPDATRNQPAMGRFYTIPENTMGPHQETRTNPRNEHMGSFLSSASQGRSDWGILNPQAPSNTAATGHMPSGVPNVPGVTEAFARGPWSSFSPNVPPPGFTMDSASSVSSRGSQRPRKDDTQSSISSLGIQSTGQTFESRLPKVHHSSGSSVASNISGKTASVATGPIRSLQSKLTGAPKSILYALFGKDPFRRVLGPSDYITWSDGGPPHNVSTLCSQKCLSSCASSICTKPHP